MQELVGRAVDELGCLLFVLAVWSSARFHYLRWKASGASLSCAGPSAGLCPVCPEQTIRCFLELEVANVQEGLLEPMAPATHQSRQQPKASTIPTARSTMKLVFTVSSRSDFDRACIGYVPGLCLLTEPPLSHSADRKTVDFDPSGKVPVPTFSRSLGGIAAQNSRVPTGAAVRAPLQRRPPAEIVPGGGLRALRPE